MVTCYRRGTETNGRAGASSRDPAKSHVGRYEYSTKNQVARFGQEGLRPPFAHIGGRSSLFLVFLRFPPKVDHRPSGRGPARPGGAAWDAEQGRTPWEDRVVWWSPATSEDRVGGRFHDRRGRGGGRRDGGRVGPSTFDPPMHRTGYAILPCQSSRRRRTGFRSTWGGVGGGKREVVFGDRIRALQKPSRGVACDESPPGL